jgi:glycosyltransferase involved in cell wall biosynthesis
LKIAIDALGIHYYGGGRTATLRLLEALFSIDHHNEYVVALTQSEPSLITSSGNVQQWIAPTKNRMLLRFWAQIMFPQKFKNFDIIHFIKNLGIFGLRTKSIITIYDLTTLVYPDLFPKIDVFYWRTIQKYMLQKTDRIIAISQNTSWDIQKYYDISPDKIRVIYPSHASHFRKPTSDEVAKIRLKYNLPEKFIIHVGRIDRKKNLSLLIQAFAILRKRNDFDGNLVFVGEHYHKSQDPKIYTLIGELNLTPFVQFKGTIPDQDLAAVYGAALVAVYCSLHEGFGIVALEAMACGTPLIVTPAGAILEAVGRAAKVVPIDNPEILANTLCEILGEPSLQSEMRSLGFLQTSHFSWHKTANQTLQLYEELTQC